MSRSRAGALPLGSFHYDLPKRLLWPAVRDPRSSFLTVIVPIALPRAGAGLDLWEIDPSEYARLSRARQAFEQRFGHRPHEYRLGIATILRGRVFHRPAGVNALGAAEERVTLQAHAVRSRGAWTLYL